MAINGFRFFDSDLHVIEPADLWPRYIDPRFKDRAPVGIVEQPFSTGHLYPLDGVPFSPIDTGGFSQMASGHCVEQARARGRYDRYCEFDRRGWGPDVQLEAMDAEGIDRAVIFPTAGLTINGREYDDDAFAAALARAYNDWLADFCSEDSDRLFGAAMLHVQNIPAAIEEVRRARRELDFKGIYLRPNPVRGRNWHDPAYDPLWAACEEEGLMVGFHEGYPSRLPHAVAERFADGLADWWMTEHVTRHPIEMMYTAVCLISGGVLERFPGLTVGLLEANCGWVPYWLWRLDEHYEMREFALKDKLPELPSTYFKRQCFVSIEADEEAACPMLDRIADNVVFSTDFPHSDCAWPNASKAFLELPMRDDQKRRILWDNCQRMYGFA